MARREFKLRIDVEDNIAYLLINGKDMGTMRTRFPLRSSAVLQFQKFIPTLITGRLCKRPDDTSSRKKRSINVSLHKWGSNTITYNFQNYSSSLGESKTREGTLRALEVLARSAGLTFVEKVRHEAVMLSYMFIKVIL